MAEIRLEHKRRMGWLWLVLLLVVAALVLWWLWRNGYLGGSRVRTDFDVLQEVRTQWAMFVGSANTA